jgi:hypothetical protein
MDELGGESVETVELIRVIVVPVLAQATSGIVNNGGAKPSISGATVVAGTSVEIKVGASVTETVMP